MPRSHQQLSLISGAVVAAIVLAIWWLVLGEASPLRDYLIHSVGNLLVKANMPAVVVAILASGNVHQPSQVAFFIAMFVQWFLIGWLVSWVTLWLKSRQRKYAS